MAGQVQDSDFKFWSSHRVLIRLAGSISIFKKIQNGVVLEKKQKSTGCNWVTRSTCRVGRVMIFPIFLLTRPGSSLGSQVDPPGRAGPGFKTMISPHKNTWIILLKIKDQCKIMLFFYMKIEDNWLNKFTQYKNKIVNS